MSSHQATESSCFVHTTQKIYEEDNKSALERLGRQGTFISQALWSVRDGKGLITHTLREKKKLFSWFNRSQCPMDVIHQRNMSIKSHTLMHIMLSCSFYS